MKCWVLLIVLMAPSTLLADKGETSAGASVGVNSVGHSRALGDFRLGLSDYWALQVETGLLVSGDSPGVLGGVAVVGALEVLHWVPEVLLGWEGTFYGGDGEERALVGRLILRKYYSMEGSWWVGLGARHHVTEGGGEATAAAGVTWRLN